MSSRKVYILGNDNRVESEASGIAAINCHGQTYTSEDSGKTFISNDGLVVDENGITAATIGRRLAVLSGTGNTISYNDRITLFFLDASAGNVEVTLEHSNIDRIFIRKDASVNTATIFPASGLINGLADKGLNVQFLKITIHSDSTDFYY